MLGVHDNLTPALVGTVVVAVLVLLSNDADDVPKVVEVMQFAAGAHGLGAEAAVAPPVPVGLVAFEGVGNTPTAVMFTGVAVLYTFLRVVEEMPKRAQALYLRVAHAMLAPVYEELLVAVGARDEERGLQTGIYLRGALRSYAQLGKPTAKPEAAARVADKLHAVIKGMQDADEEDKLGAAMVAVTNALSAVKIIANETYGA
jgi:hypothetical protein